jgi:hypothetical protein
MRRIAGSLRSQSRVSRPCLEPLEDRLLLSAVYPQPLVAGVVSPNSSVAAASAVVQNPAQPAATAQPTFDTTPGDDAYSPDHTSPSSQQSYPANKSGSASSSAPAGPANSNRMDTGSETEDYQRSPSYRASPATQAVDMQIALAQGPQPSSRPQRSALASAAGLLPESSAPPPADKAPVNLVKVDSQQPGPHGGSVSNVMPPFEVAPQNEPSSLVEEQPGASVSRMVAAPSGLAPQAGDPFAGELPIDLVALERAANEFFARLEGLAADLTALPAAVNVTGWLVVTAAALGACEFLRGWLKPPRALRAGAGSVDRAWVSFPVLAVLPPEDAP